MSFRSAYYGLKSGRKPSTSQGYFRDPTPEEWKKRMDEYYKQQRRRQTSAPTEPHKE